MVVLKVYAAGLPFAFHPAFSMSKIGTTEMSINTELLLGGEPSEESVVVRSAGTS